MRIGLDYRPVTAAPYSGIARQVLAMEQTLRARSGVDVVRFTACPADHPHRQSALCPPWDSPLHGLHRPRQRQAFEGRFLPAAIAASELDWYVATANVGLPRRGHNAATRYALLLHDVFQLTLQNNHANWLKRAFYRVIDRRSVSHSVSVAARIFTPSQFTADEVSRLFPQAAHKLAVLPSAVPLQAKPLWQALPPGLPQHYWLLVGTREPRKNVPWFISQWQQARRQDGRVPPLLLIGAAQDVAPSLRALDGLYWLAGISDALLLQLYAQAWRLWQPSFAEGFGMPVIEALGQGTPVAVARGSALDEIVPADTPRFDPYDGAALQHLMRALAAQDSGIRQDDATRRAWAQRYDLPAYGERLWGCLDGTR
jgi:glycosyltransferase involved in cell wall biosynthesis